MKLGQLIKKVMSKRLPQKCPYSEFFWAAFLTFEFNTERYSVSLRLQFEWGKIRTRKTPNTDIFYAVNA